MNSPIQNRIGAVFVPVSDMQRAIRWYSTLLGVPAADPSHGGTIYDVPMAGEVNLILDANRPVQNSSQPLLFFWTEDIHAARRFLEEQSVRLAGEIEDIGSVLVLTFTDPDGNLLMVCQRRHP